MTPQELLTAAILLMRRPDAATVGIWPRAAALLARQALELAMAAMWAAGRDSDAGSERVIRQPSMIDHLTAPCSASGGTAGTSTRVEVRA